jgi:hypothetical protein
MSNCDPIINKPEFSSGVISDGRLPDWYIEAFNRRDPSPYPVGFTVKIDQPQASGGLSTVTFNPLKPRKKIVAVKKAYRLDDR